MAQMRKFGNNGAEVLDQPAISLGSFGGPAPGQVPFGSTPPPATKGNAADQFDETGVFKNDMHRQVQWTDPKTAQASETPRARAQVRSAPKAAPSRPKTPTPMAGSVSQAEPGATASGDMMAGGEPSGGMTAPTTEPGPMLFEPMPGPDPNAFVAPLSSKLRSGGMFGSMGGLQGGGLGMPFDPTANEQSDPISTLLQLLKAGGGY
jgi:hypothetical protein